MVLVDASVVAMRHTVLAVARLRVWLAGLAGCSVVTAVRLLVVRRLVCSKGCADAAERDDADCAQRYGGLLECELHFGLSC